MIVAEEGGGHHGDGEHREHDQPRAARPWLRASAVSASTTSGGSHPSAAVMYGFAPVSAGTTGFALASNDMSPGNGCFSPVCTDRRALHRLRPSASLYTLLCTVRPSRPVGFTTSTATMITSATVSLSSVPTR